MSGHVKSEGFMRELIRENEERYGAEVREKYGDAAVDASNARLMGLTPDQYDKAQELSRQFSEALKAAFGQGDPAGETAQKACALHREWLGYFWAEYSKEAHLSLAQTYKDDLRFRELCDAIAEGSAAFFRDALAIFCEILGIQRPLSPGLP